MEIKWHIGDTRLIKNVLKMFSKMNQNQYNILTTVIKINQGKTCCACANSTINKGVQQKINKCKGGLSLK